MVPASGCVDSGQHAQERGLPAAVRSQQAQAYARGEHEVEVAHDRAPVEPLGHAMGLEQALRAPVRAREVDGHGRGAGPRVEVGQLFLEPPRLVDARLGLAGSRLRLAREPLDLAAHAVVQGLLVGGLTRELLVLLLQELAVAPADLEEPGSERAVQLDHAAGHRLEEVAVVAHGQEGLGLAAQQVLEPEDAVEVEVVRGLVQEQQLGLAAQLAGDGQALPPAAREEAGRLVPVLEAGLAHGQARARLGFVLVHPGTRRRPRAGPKRRWSRGRNRDPAGRSRCAAACAARAPPTRAARARPGSSGAWTCPTRSGPRGRCGRRRRCRRRGLRRAAPRRRPW